MVCRWHATLPSIMDANVKQDMGKLFSHKLSLVTQITWASISCLIHRFRKTNFPHRTWTIAGSPGEAEPTQPPPKNEGCRNSTVSLHRKCCCEWWKARWSVTQGFPGPQKRKRGDPGLREAHIWVPSQSRNSTSWLRGLRTPKPGQGEAGVGVGVRWGGGCSWHHAKATLRPAAGQSLRTGPPRTFLRTQGGGAYAARRVGGLGEPVARGCIPGQLSPRALLAFWGNQQMLLQTDLVLFTALTSQCWDFYFFPNNNNGQYWSST